MSIVAGATVHLSSAINIIGWDHSRAPQLEMGQLVTSSRKPAVIVELVGLNRMFQLEHCLEPGLELDCSGLALFCCCWPELY